MHTGDKSVWTAENAPPIKWWLSGFFILVWCVCTQIGPLKRRIIIIIIITNFFLSFAASRNSVLRYTVITRSMAVRIWLMSPDEWRRFVYSSEYNQIERASIHWIVRQMVDIDLQLWFSTSWRKWECKLFDEEMSLQLRWYLGHEFPHCQYKWNTNLICFGEKRKDQYTSELLIWRALGHRACHRVRFRVQLNSYENVSFKWQINHIEKP